MKYNGYFFQNFACICTFSESYRSQQKSEKIQQLSKKTGFFFNQKTQ